MAKEQNKLSKLDWSLLPEELLDLIAKNLENEDYCFDVVHARSVCTSWRSSFPFPSCLLTMRQRLPTFIGFPFESMYGSFIVEKIPLFLLRVKAPAAVSPSEYYLGEIKEPKVHTELPSPIQCTLKMTIPESGSTVMNMLGCQIISLGHQYRLIYVSDSKMPRGYGGMAYLPLEVRGKREFVVVVIYNRYVLALQSEDMQWMPVNRTTWDACESIVSFRGKFYAVLGNGDICVIDPYSLLGTPLLPSIPYNSFKYLVPSGDDELFLVEKILPVNYRLVDDLNNLPCRVRRLDEATGTWVVVSDLGGRVLFLGELGNIFCSVKELPDGCGISGNSILFTNEYVDETFAYKYGVNTGNADDDLSFWRSSRENLVEILTNTPPVVALWIDH
ncbi:hypothetical protein CARUB_v10023404mg [Capsella rubella]|uniref:F-box domain-containing protein n=1 Tax=Capsella rubella TaxID=81985 RepID=R0FWF3_9BRAS|nr:F-box/kelch-repeat protein At1g64840 [Capsella rubella]EOA27287.1 hypothetical protein CARUB_v10023404mg [Capsella rubella]